MPDESTPDPKVECGGDARHDREMWRFLIPHSQEVDKEQFVLCLGDTLIIRQHSAIDRQWAGTTRLCADQKCNRNYSPGEQSIYFFLWLYEWIYPPGVGIGTLLARKIGTHYYSLSVAITQNLLREWRQAVHRLCRLERADLHASPVHACERPVSRKRLRANQV